MTNRLWILAGTYQQYLYYMHKIRDIASKKECQVDFKYLSEGQKLLGHRREHFIRVGTWNTIRTMELDEILTLLNALEFIEIDYTDKERFNMPMDHFLPWVDNKFEFILEQEMTI